MIVRVNVVLNRTIADTDCCFDNLAVVIFRVKVSCITSIDCIKLWLLSVNNQSSIPPTDVKQLTLTLKMTTAQVVKTSVNVNKRPLKDYVHPDDHAQPTYEVTPGFKPFTVLYYNCNHHNYNKNSLN